MNYSSRSRVLDDYFQNNYYKKLTAIIILITITITASITFCLTSSYYLYLQQDIQAENVQLKQDNSHYWMKLRATNLLIKNDSLHKDCYGIGK